MSRVRVVQHFSAEAIEQGLRMSVTDRARFLEDFRLLHASVEEAPQAPSEASRLISLRVPEDLLRDFKRESARRGIRYQTLIKTILRDWLLKNAV